MTNENIRIDRTLLSLKQSIQRRIEELERVWSNKKAKLEVKEDVEKEVLDAKENGSRSDHADVKSFDGRFLSFVAQLANKDLLNANLSLADSATNPKAISERLEPIAAKVNSRPSATVKKKVTKPKASEMPAERISPVPTLESSSVQTDKVL